MTRQQERLTDEGATDGLDELEDSGLLATRLENLLDVATSLAELDFSKRAELHGDGAFLDGLAYSLNVLSEELRESTVSRDYLDGIIRSMAEGLLIVDEDGTITDINPALSRLLGRHRDDLVGQPWGAVCTRPRAELLPGRGDSIEDATYPSGRRVETELVRADGSRVEVALSGSILRRPGSAGHWMYVVRDITAHKELARNLANARDAALHSAQVTASFLANMSHEIRTPLNGVIGMSWLLLDDGGSDGARIDPATRAKVETIHDSATLLLDIVNDILDLSKLESGSAELHEDDLDLANVVENLLHVYALRAEQKSIELVLDLDPELPSRVRGDVGSLRQVLGNLISNAIKFTDDGEVVVVVRAERRSDPTTVRFEVRDTGIGIAEHLQATIFEAFQQAETSTARKYGGTGLGLTICHRLVTLMGGRIGCDSRLGAGATFWFELPYQRVVERQEPESPRFLTGRTVLVVDDHPLQRRVLGRTIEHWGGDALLASDIASARTGSTDPRPSIALVDWPSSTVTNRRLLQELSRDLGGPEVVLLTSISAPPSLAELRPLGAVAEIPKPAKPSRLLNLLRSRVESSLRRSPRPGPEDSSQTAFDLPLLVVEDNDVNQTVIQGQLRRLGLTARLAKDGREAVEAVASRRFGLVLMDLYMPRMDGYEATERIRRLEHGAELPIVAVTANATEQVRSRCFAVGMDDFLSKPLRIDQLASTLSRWLGLALTPSRDARADATIEEVAVTTTSPSSPASEPRRVDASGSPAPDAGAFPPDARVLVVDDNHVNRRVVLGMLARVRITADDAPSGAQALEALAERRYHAVLMDVEMTGIDGLATTRMVRRRESTRRTPIIAVTGHDSGQERDRCAAADMDDFLTKPMHMADLVARLALWLGLARPSILPATVDRLLTDDPSGPLLAALNRLADAPRMISTVRETFARASRRRLDRLRRTLETLDEAPETPLEHSAMQAWHRDAFALLTWTANLGAERLAGLAATLDTCRPDERRFLLDLLDREIAELAHS